MLLRAVLFAACLAGSFLAGRLAFRDDAHEQTIAALHEELDGLRLRLELLRERRRVAVIDQIEPAPSVARPGGRRTAFRFRELGPDGATLGTPQRFEIEGDLVYVDALVVKFDDEFVEQRDLLRGSTVLLFRRIFGEFQAPADGYPIDAAGLRPLAYEVEAGPPAFHRELWAEFWRYANDPEVARRSGVRAMHGEAPSMRLASGRSYEIELRSSEGLTLRVMEPPAERDVPR